jgi:hypothetical protein
MVSEGGGSPTEFTTQHGFSKSTPREGLLNLYPRHKVQSFDESFTSSRTTTCINLPQADVLDEDDGVVGYYIVTRRTNAYGAR